MSDFPQCPQCSATITAVTAVVDAQAIAHRHETQCGHVLTDRQARHLWALGYRWTLPRIDGVSLGAAERLRQVVEEGHTPTKDADRRPGDLAWAAWCLIDRAATGDASPEPPAAWPWAPEEWKPDKTPMRQLIIAQALIAAEVDRQLMEQRRQPNAER